MSIQVGWPVDTGNFKIAQENTLWNDNQILDIRHVEDYIESGDLVSWTRIMFLSSPSMPNQRRNKKQKAIAMRNPEDIYFHRLRSLINEFPDPSPSDPFAIFLTIPYLKKTETEPNMESKTTVRNKE